MRAILALFLAAIAAATASGQTIDCPDKVDAGEPVRVTIAALPERAFASFLPTDQVDTSWTKIRICPNCGQPFREPPVAMFRAKEPGTYTIYANIALTNETGVYLGQQYITKKIEVTGEAPPPDPFLNPYPVPGPQWKAAVQKILSSGPPRYYAKDRAERFNRLAETVRQGRVPTVRSLWDLMAAEKAEGSWPATKTAVAGVLEEHLGRADVPLSVDDADKMLMAIAWAIKEASR